MWIGQSLSTQNLNRGSSVELEVKDFGWISKIISLIVAASVGLAINRSKISDLTKRVTALENGKMGKLQCQTIQENHKDKFLEGTTEFKEVKQLIKDSNKLHQDHHDSLVKMFMELKR
jgi:hypothetical protein